MATAPEEFLRLLRACVADGTFVKLTLGRYRGGDGTLRNLYVRPVNLRAGPHLSFVWRHATRDITKNHPPADGLSQLGRLIGTDFGTAQLFAATQDAQLEFPAEGMPHLKLIPHAPTAPAAGVHDRPKERPIAAGGSWLHALGVTTATGAVRERMAAKFRQINRFVELVAPLVKAATLPPDRPVQVADMGCGKGYLTFAIWQHFRDVVRRPAQIRGVEQRAELVELCNRTSRDGGCTGLEFIAGTIASLPPTGLDVLIALHACDTATDDAIAKGIHAGAALIVVAPCCHRELSPQLTAPPVLGPALRHGIFHERQAEFVTDALRTLLLDWAGYDTQAFEFIATEHTAKNLMIAAVRRTEPTDRESAAVQVRNFAGFYGIRTQQLARLLDFPLTP